MALKSAYSTLLNIALYMTLSAASAVILFYLPLAALRDAEWTFLLLYITAMFAGICFTAIYLTRTTKRSALDALGLFASGLVAGFSVPAAIILFIPNLFSDSLVTFLNGFFLQSEKGIIYLLIIFGLAFLILGVPIAFFSKQKNVPTSKRGPTIALVLVVLAFVGFNLAFRGNYGFLEKVFSGEVNLPEVLTVWITDHLLARILVDALIGTSILSFSIANIVKKLRIVIASSKNQTPS